jgi:hypothetical protein
VSLLIIKTVYKMTQIQRIIPILVFATTALVFTSCSKKDEITESLTEGEAVEIIESALQSNVGGLTTNLEDVTEQLITAVTSGQLCDTLYTSTIEKDQQGTQVQASYTSDLSYQMTCNIFDIPQTASFSVSTTAMYATPRIDSDDNGDFTGNVTGLEPSSSIVNIGGNYSSTGTQNLDFVEQKSISSAFEVDLTNLEMNKQNYMIESGTAVFSFTGSTADENFSYSGNITFNGNNTATIIINGTTYEIDWN